MGEWADEWPPSKAHLWGAVPRIIEMQSGGRCRRILQVAPSPPAHWAPSFTASQGLLLFILNPTRWLASDPFVPHGGPGGGHPRFGPLGDHSDVMACRATWLRAPLASTRVQESR